MATIQTLFNQANSAIASIDAALITLQNQSDSLNSDPITVNTQISASNTTVDQTPYYNKAESDTLFVSKSGGDIDGSLTVSSNITTSNIVSSNVYSQGYYYSNGTSIFSGIVSHVGIKNRLINGDMTFDQRNAGANVNISDTGSQYPLDRWKAYASHGTNIYRVSRMSDYLNDLPIGFNNCLVVTSFVTFTPTTDAYHTISQTVENANWNDMLWGTNNAKPATLSFWVKSSLTGTFSGKLDNSTISRTYVFTYTITQANVWSKISITIPGDTTGTWIQSSSTFPGGAGVRLVFNLGVGSFYNANTINGWSSETYKWGAPGAVNMVANGPATWYLTGVQLEPGSLATDFERRGYGQELLLCQRYTEAFTNNNAGFSLVSQFFNGTQNAFNLNYKVAKRVVPNFVLGTGSTYTTNTPNGFALSRDNAYIYSTVGVFYISGLAGTVAAYLDAEY
jgi:hypothetical protein